MNRIQDFFIRLMIVLADIFFSAFVFCLFESRTIILRWDFLPWIIFVFAIFLLDYIVAQKNIHTNVYFAINVIAIIAFSLYGQRYFEIEEVRALSTRILYAVALSVPVVHGSVVAYKPLDRHKMLLYFDALVLLEIIFVGLGSSTVFPLSQQFRMLGMVAVAGFLSALMIHRMLNEEEGSRKKLIGQTIMLSFVAFLSVIALLASNVFEKASESAINAGKAVVIFIFNIFVWFINLILKWLSSLINTVIVAEVPEIKIKEFGLDKTIYDGKWVIPIFLVILGLCLLGVYIRLRGKRIKGQRNKKGKGRNIRESHFIRGVSKFFFKITGNIRFVISYIISYNKVSGLMVWTELHYRKRLISKERGESFSDYLERLAVKVKTEEAKAMMREFSTYVDKHYYSEEKQILPEGFSSEYRKAIRHS